MTSTYTMRVKDARTSATADVDVEDSMTVEVLKHLLLQRGLAPHSALKLHLVHHGGAS